MDFVLIKKRAKKTKKCLHGNDLTVVIVKNKKHLAKKYVNKCKDCKKQKDYLKGRDNG